MPKHPADRYDPDALVPLEQIKKDIAAFAAMVPDAARRLARDRSANRTRVHNALRNAVVGVTDEGYRSLRWMLENVAWLRIVNCGKVSFELMYVIAVQRGWNVTPPDLQPKFGTNWTGRRLRDGGFPPVPLIKKDSTP
jgi:hypothetical protein